MKVLPFYFYRGKVMKRNIEQKERHAEQTPSPPCTGVERQGRLPVLQPLPPTQHRLFLRKARENEGASLQGDMEIERGINFHNLKILL